jgi:methionyl-tRNA formyltransferase
MENKLRDPLSALFFISITPSAAPALAGWIESGNHISAVVIHDEKSHFTALRHDRLRALLAPLWSITAILRRHRIPLIELNGPIDWQVAAERLAAHPADILISHFFDRLIPDDVLRMVPHGGVNLHPALLPDYRGVHPIHKQLLDGTWQRCGGLTLHVMSNRFDRGDIIAQIPFQPEDWVSSIAFTRALASTAKALTSTAVRLYCSGQLQPQPQTEAVYPWARLEKGDLLVGPGMTADQFGKLSWFMGNSGGLFIEQGDQWVRLGPLIGSLGPASGAPPRNGRITVDFDVADARLRTYRDSRLLRRVVRWRYRAALVLAGIKPVEFIPETSKERHS